MKQRTIMCGSMPDKRTPVLLPEDEILRYSELQDIALAGDEEMIESLSPEDRRTVQTIADNLRLGAYVQEIKDIIKNSGRR